MVLPLIIGILLGGIVGVLAEQKNRQFFPWALYGFFFFFFAIIHIAVIGDKEYEDRQLEGMGYKKCPACAGMIHAEAIACKHCGGTAGSASPTEASHASEEVRTVSGDKGTCRWCKQTYVMTAGNKCPSCGGLQKHFLKDNPILLVLIFCLMLAFLVVLTQGSNEPLQPLSSPEELSTF